MKKKPEFHGSDLEKIADYYHLNKENIILFGANVNPLGLSGQVKKDLAEHLDIISSYPDRDYTDLKKAIFACLTIDFPSIITLKPSESDIPIVTDTR